MFQFIEMTDCFNAMRVDIAADKSHKTRKTDNQCRQFRTFLKSEQLQQKTLFDCLMSVIK